jgi:hypothetical protein
VIDDRLGEDAPEGKWVRWLRDDAWELDEHGPNAAGHTDSSVKSG